MAVAFDATMTTGNDGGDVASAAGASSISSTGITVGASATALIVSLSFESTSGAFPTSVAVTWNGVSMTAGPSLQTFVTARVSTYIFYLANPTSGAKTLAASWTNAQDCYMAAASFTGVDTTTPIVVADNQTGTGNVTITTANNDATVAVATKDSNEPTVNNTKYAGVADLAPGFAAQYKLSTGASDSHTFTFSGGANQATVGVHILASAGGAGPSGLAAGKIVNPRPLRKVGHPMYPHH